MNKTKGTKLLNEDELNDVTGGRPDDIIVVPVTPDYVIDDINDIVSSAPVLPGAMDGLTKVGSIKVKTNKDQKAE